MKPKVVEAKPADVGVIVGRFHTPKLTPAHVDLISYVTNRHKKVLVFLGVAIVPGSKKNPLDFISRKLMVEEAFPEVIVLSIKDCKTDEEWSKQLDSRIREIVPTHSVTLYGARDSFIEHYEGTFQTQELEATSYINLSATAAREETAKEIVNSEDYRKGMIASAYNRFIGPAVTVDVVVYRVKSGKCEFLLGRKPGETGYRAIGGFVDATDSTFSDAIKRELREEAGNDMEVAHWECLGDFNIPDWRYRGDRSTITTFYVCQCLWGEPKPDDDIEELRWFKAEEVVDDLTVPIVSEHISLITRLGGWYDTKFKCEA